jgi:hypothetical protein
MYQPNDPILASILGEEEKVVHPDQVARASGHKKPTWVKQEAEAGCARNGGESELDHVGFGDNGVAGNHWFEVVPVNQIQGKLIDISMK